MIRSPLPKVITSFFDATRISISHGMGSRSSLHAAEALDLLPQTQQVARDGDRMENWSVIWASDKLKQEPRAFASATFTGIQAGPAHRDDSWSITFLDHAAYVDARDAVKREQMAKAGARLANVLNAVWP
jgi:hypothetical protein